MHLVDHFIQVWQFHFNYAKRLMNASPFFFHVLLILFCSEHDAPVTAVAVSADGLKILCGTKAVRA